MELRPSKQIRPFPNFQRPTIAGTFSVDRNRNYEDSMEKLKYLKIPAVIDFNLNEGDEAYVGKDDSAKDENLKHLLEYIKRNVKTMSRPDFVCFRGLMR